MSHHKPLWAFVILFSITRVDFSIFWNVFLFSLDLKLMSPSLYRTFSLCPELPHYLSFHYFVHNMITLFIKMYCGYLFTWMSTLLPFVLLVGRNYVLFSFVSFAPNTVLPELEKEQSKHLWIEWLKINCKNMYKVVLMIRNICLDK